MIETIAAVNQAVNSFIWGIPAMVCIIGVGLLLSVRTGFLQIRKFPYAIRTTVGRMFRKRDASDGAMTPFQAVCTALAGTVGTGNIAGVAGAIAIGGPGAVFWMWCSALLGMCTKFAEVTLAVHFRERSDTGEWVGGPMYYIKNGLGRRWQFLAVLYALFGVLTVFGTGNATQVNTIVAAVDTALLEYGLVGGSFLPTLNLIVGILVAVLVALVLLGGIKRIGSVSEKLVPLWHCSTLCCRWAWWCSTSPACPMCWNPSWRVRSTPLPLPAAPSAVCLSVCKRAFPAASFPTRPVLAPALSPMPAPTPKSRSSRACSVFLRCLPIPSSSAP